MTGTAAAASIYCSWLAQRLARRPSSHLLRLQTRHVALSDVVNSGCRSKGELAVARQGRAGWRHTYCCCSPLPQSADVKAQLSLVSHSFFLLGPSRVGCVRCVSLMFSFFFWSQHFCSLLQIFTPLWCFIRLQFSFRLSFRANQKFRIESVTNRITPSLPVQFFKNALPKYRRMFCLCNLHKYQSSSAWSKL